MWTLQLTRFFADLLCPHTCVGCGVVGTLLCDKCYCDLQWLPCPAPSTVCPELLDSISILGAYQKPLDSLIKAMKYQSVKDAATLCGELLYYHTPLPTIDAITYVPLHPKKHSQRGFNQAELIAETVAKKSGVPLLPLLVRIKHQSAQAQTTSRTVRLERLVDTYRVVSCQNQLPHSMLLIDDVMTTGATLTACAKLLKQAGVQKIHGLVLAHGS